MFKRKYFKPNLECNPSVKYQVLATEGNDFRRDNEGRRTV